MPLYNAAKRARNATSISNQNQGGGSKKAGFPQQVGRSSAVSVAFHMTNPVCGHCCKLSNMNATVFPLARFSRPIGTAPGANRAKFL
uniref:Uncharacterized protein n=1 Tax=viral metagenome TaxID=1070528 RepID=A0A6C0KIH3_9ZZZZ